MADQHNDNNNLQENSGQKPATSLATDLPDSPKDQAKMQPEEVIIELPDVSDIPGQETVHVPPLGELADTTISSDDEEGVGLFGDDDVDEDTQPVMGTDADVSKDEQNTLEKTANDLPTEDDIRLRRAELDETDMEGEQLNEGSNATNVGGNDLDTSGVDADDAMEDIGEEDEENNSYSFGSDSNDNMTEGTP